MGRRVELDNRGLEPPQPMIRILDTLKGLADDDILVAHNDRQPMFLYPELEELGYTHETQQMDDGSYRITIHKRR